jgi:O-methyltransferase
MVSSALAHITTARAEATPESLYLELLKRCLTRSIAGEGHAPYEPRKGSLRRLLYGPLARVLAARRLKIVRDLPFDAAARAEGRDWPAEAETMTGLKRLDSLQRCIETVLAEDVRGDLIETGVWRGGSSIFMRGALKAFGDTERVVWAADSFQGLPKPDPSRHPADRGDTFWTWGELAVSLAEVKENFARYGLLDEQVRFLPGWFRDTLPAAPIDRLALLRLDGDLYESTIVALRSLYPKLSIGGYMIVDDYAVPNCRAAVDDYRAEYGISEELEPVDWTCVLWKRAR